MGLQDEKTLYIIVTGDYSDPEDEGVQGIYEIGVAGHLQDGQQREAALDQFHDHVAIATLDDFRIDVLNAEGTSLDVIEDYENGELASFAEYYGGIDADQAPSRVAEVFAMHSAQPGP